MVYPTGLWAKCSSGTVGISLFQVHLPTLVSSRCNNVLYIISVLSLFLRVHDPYLFRLHREAPPE